MFSLAQKIPNMLPKPNKRMQRLQRQRREQLKSVVGDVSRIAINEIERFNTLAMDLLTEETDNPIVLEYSEKEEDQEDEVSI